MRTAFRRRGRGRGALVAACLAASLAACGGDGGPEDEQPVPPPAPGPADPGVQVEVILPDSVGWAQAGEVRLRVANRGRAPLEGGRLELFVAAPARPVLPAGGPQARDTAGGSLVVFPVAPLPPGQAADFAQRVRLPPSTPPAAGADTTMHGRFPVRARVLDAAGAPAGPATTDTLEVFRAATAALGCGGAGGKLPVTRYGVGTVRLGITRQAVESICPGVRDTAWAGPEGMREKGLAIPFGTGDTLLAVLAGERLERLRVTRPGLATAAGAGVGTTLGELRTRYGRTCAGVGEGRVAVWFPNAPGISFALSARPSPEWSRVERDPALLPDTATVTELWVWRGTDDCPAPAPAAGAPSPEAP